MTEDPDKNLPGYDEPLDSPFLDEDPDFRETLRILNAAGVHTVSSCQGHAPGTQYESVQEWMAPYITVRINKPDDVPRACELLRTAGENEWAEISTASPKGKILCKFPLDWKWSRSVAFLKARLPVFR